MDWTEFSAECERMKQKERAAVMQGDVEQLLRDASRIVPLPILADDPRINSYGRQLATMMLLARQPHGGGTSK